MGYYVTLNIKAYVSTTEIGKLTEAGDDESRSTPACTQTTWTGSGPDVVHMCSSAAPNRDPEVIRRHVTSA